MNIWRGSATSSLPKALVPTELSATGQTVGGAAGHWMSIAAVNGRSGGNGRGSPLSLQHRHEAASVWWRPGAALGTAPPLCTQANGRTCLLVV